MEKDVNKLYKRKWLNLAEVAFLLGGIPRTNLYPKLYGGRIPYSIKKNKRNQEVIRVDSKDVYDYVIQRRKDLSNAIRRYPLPSVEIDWNHRDE